MARSFDVSVTSTAGVEEIVAAFGDRGYWTARLAEFSGGTATLDSLSIDDDGTVNVVVAIGMFRDRLPKMVTQVYRGDLTMVRSETWTRTSGGRARGDISVAVPGAPLSARGTALLSPERNGSRLNYTTTVTVNVPVVGGRIESYMGGQLAEGIPAIQRFTTRWIGEKD